MAEVLTGIEGYGALANGAAAGLERDAVSVSGPEAGRYLQGQLSQDVERMAVGATTWSWVLQPTGKVDALVRVTRTADLDWVLDTDGGFGEALVSRLTRFKLRTKADVTSLDWKALALRGRQFPALGAPEGAAEAPGGGIAAPAGAVAASAGGIAAPAGGIAAPAGGIAVGAWPGIFGIDLLGESPEAPAGVPWVSTELAEVARIEAGVPKMGAELTDSTIPAETGLIGETVSFTKGCFTGQELVARIDSRGSNVPRHLCGLLFGGPSDVGAALISGGKKAGTVTSVAESPGRGWVGLGYVGRAVKEGDRVVVEDGTTVEVRDLPLSS